MLENVLNALQSNIVEILMTILTALVSYIGITLKNLYTKYINDKTKKSIVEATVKYVEQVGGLLNSQEKLQKAKEKALEWLEEKGISISDTELEVLIESFVNSLKESE